MLPLILRVMVVAGIVLAKGAAHAQEPAGEAPPALRPWRDADTGLFGAVDSTGKMVHAAEYDLVLGGDDAIAMGFKRTGGRVSILRLSGPVHRVKEEEFWSAWRAALLESDISDKQLIARVMDLYPDHGTRLRELESLEQIYRHMAEVRKAALKNLRPEE